MSRSGLYDYTPGEIRPSTKTRPRAVTAGTAPSPRLRRRRAGCLDGPDPAVGRRPGCAVVRFGAGKDGLVRRSPGFSAAGARARGHQRQRADGGPNVSKFQREILPMPQIQPVRETAETCCRRRSHAPKIWGYNGLYPDPLFRQTENGVYAVVSQTNELPNSASTPCTSPDPRGPRHDEELLLALSHPLAPLPGHDGRGQQACLDCKRLLRAAGVLHGRLHDARHTGRPPACCSWACMNARSSASSAGRRRQRSALRLRRRAGPHRRRSWPGRLPLV